MGVHGLWELLAPVGRRVSVETLAGRRLAIDASIWMVQFMKAMRDEKGEMVRNAHLLGFFRRICKLLYLRTKPVFIFDGGTPALKRRTVIARRRQRENAQSKLRKTAEKLLLNHLKAMKLKDLAEDIKNQRQNQKNDAKVKEGLRGQTTRMGDSNLEKNNAALLSSNQERLDEILAASIQAEEEGGLTRNASKISAAVPSEEDGEEDDEEMILPETHGEVDPAVLANLPPSMQHGLLLQTNKLDNDAKGKKVMSDQIEMMGINSENYGVVSRSCNQEKLDEMIAASIAAENDTDVTNASTSTASMVVEEDVDEEDDDDEEMILPAMYGEVDPAVLAALPPSMQLDLLVQIRERLMAENRQKYQKVKKDPEKFSELQIQSYLKTVAFRREIDQVQKAAAGRGVSGVQSSRIASEAHREFIFSSSFTGDKQGLASSRVERNGDKQQASKEHTSNFRNNVPSTNNASTTVERSGDKQQASKEYPSNFKNNIPSKNNVTGSTPEESTSAFDDSIETYLDDRGHRRVSRVRAMGIRMTRDLQRNLDLMKEIEQEKTNANKISNAGNMLNEISNDILRGSRSNKAVTETSCGDGGGSVDTGVWRSHPGQKKVVESSVGDNDLNERNEQFMLKLETPIEISIEDAGESKYFDGDDDLFASLVAGNPVAFSANDMLRRQSSDSDSDCDWEEGIVEGNRSSFPNDEEVKIKVPHMEGNNSDDSEVEWEEGVCGNTQNTSCLPGEYGKTISKGYIEEEASLQEAIRRSLEDIGDECKGAEFVDGENKMVEPVLLEKIGTQQNESSSDIVDGVKEMDTVRHFYSPAQAMHNVSERDPLGVKEGHVITQQVLLDTFDGDGGLSSFPNILEENNAHSSDALSGDVTDCIDDHKNEIEMANPAALVESLTKNLIKESDAGKKGVEEKSHDDFFQESEHSWEKSSLTDDKDTLIEATEANLEEEMRILGQECMDLGDERRRLERNVESVSSEMFTECQALLQMFGIPYIIAPMEAEAQCAYMELANLVDGVVTDDSDVFLFGGRSVYKNIFDDRKYVETYFMKDVENELGLSREKLIRMALLLGSDYTEGVSGIGIVNAIEVLNAFPEEDGLQKFRDWIESPDPTILGKPDGETGSIARKKGSNDINTKSNTEDVSSDLLQEMKETFMDKHRKVSKNWHIPPSFPSEAVSSAYTCPQVDKSTEPFTWGKPDHFVLRKLCWEKFGWGNQKADELLIPVLKEYDKRETQLRLEAFYTFNERFAKIRSKRIKKAVKGITGNQSSELMDEAAQEVSRSRKKRSVSTDEAGDDKSEKLSDGTNKSVLRNQSNSKGKSTTKQSRKRKTTKQPVPSEQPKPAEARQTTNRRLHANRKGRGRGRRSVLERGKGKEKENPNAEVSETSSSNGDGDNDGMDLHMETIEGSGEVRRSGRLRKPVNYTVNLEIDDVDEPLDHSDTKCSNEEAGDQVLSWDESILEDGTSGLSEKKHQNAGNLSPKAGLGKDYLDTGGGFCPVEDETGELGSSQHGEPSLRADVSEDYLKLGGRFCRDDGEVGDDQDQDGIPFQPTATASENSNHPHFSTFADEADLGRISVQHSLGTESSLVGFQGGGRTDAYDAEQSVNHGITTNNDDHSKLSGSLMDNSVDNPGHPSVGGLTAMPFLRKKRRKT